MVRRKPLILGGLPGRISATGEFFEWWAMRAFLTLLPRPLPAGRTGTDRGRSFHASATRLAPRQCDGHRLVHAWLRMDEARLRGSSVFAEARRRRGRHDGGTRLRAGGDCVEIVVLTVCGTSVEVVMSYATTTRDLSSERLQARRARYRDCAGTRR